MSPFFGQVQRLRWRLRRKRAWRIRFLSRGQGKRRPRGVACVRKTQPLLFIFWVPFCRILVQLRPAGLPSERRHASTCDGQDQGLEIMVGTPCSIHPIGFARCLEADPPLVQNSPWVGRCLHVLPAHNSFPSHLNYFLSQFSRCHSHTHSHSHPVLLVISPAFLGGIRPRGSSVPFFLLPLLLRVGVLVLPPLDRHKTPSPKLVIQVGDTS